MPPPWDRIARVPLQRLSTGGAILCYHSVTTPETPAAGAAHVPVEAFKEMIRLVRRLGELAPVSDLVERHAQGRRTAGLVAVTFDDAYASLLTELADFISREGVPVGVFAVTRAAADGATYWWDRIDDAFPRAAAARWRAFEDACGVPESYRRQQPPGEGPLRPLRQWLLAAYAGRWPDRLEGALAALESETGTRTRQRSMTFDELGQVAAIPSVEVGVHTVSHPVLPLLDDRDLAHEIGASYAELRERLGAVLPVLAAPYGLYDARTVQAARAAGLTACLSVSGANLGGAAVPPHVLPRYCVTSSDTPARLALRLLGWRDRVRRWCRRPLPLYPALPSPTS
jgi:peptidoglycan/xylan/chitin deacetylase (PgdA/CDA1 family)